MSNRQKSTGHLVFRDLLVFFATTVGISVLVALRESGKQG